MSLTALYSGVGNDGTLDFVRKYDVETNGKFQWWMGVVGLPGRD